METPTQTIYVQQANAGPCLKVYIDIVVMAIRLHRPAPFGLSPLVIEEGEKHWNQPMSIGTVRVTNDAMLYIYIGFGCYSVTAQALYMI